MQRTIPTRTGLALLLAAILLGAVLGGGSAHPAAAQGLDPTPTATPLADQRPDRCEPNNDQARACRIELDAVSGPYTFLPEGDTDYYSLFLGEQADGLETTITVRATSGLDLYTTIRRADTNAIIGTIASPAISTTLTADVIGWVVIRAENRGAAIASGQSYRIETRRTLPSTPAAPATGGPEGLERAAATPDALENNWSPETAAPIGVGVVYDLTFVCPVDGGCEGGDHDYLRFETKRGMSYLLTTFDLADGVDTVLDLLWWSPTGGWQVIASNDDERPGSAFLSTLRWQAPGDGHALVRIAPRSGGLNPILLEGQPTYRFAIALADSPLADQLEARIARQTNAPEPTAVSAPVEPAASGGVESGGAGSPAAAPVVVEPTRVAIEQSGAGGQAMVVSSVAAHTAPDESSPVLGEIPVDAIVSLTGRTAGLWAEVTSGAIVGAAWVDRRALRPTTAAAAVASATTSPASDTGAGTAGTARPVPTPAQPTSVAGGQAQPVGSGNVIPAVVADAEPLPLPSPAPAPQSESGEAQVTVTAGGKPLRGLRVLLVTIFDEVAGEQVTAEDGKAVFKLSVTANTALFIVLPELGVRVRVNSADPFTTVTLPEASQ